MKLSARGLAALAASLAIALAVVLGAEALTRLVRSPKALPFESTRTGTLAEVVRAREEPLDVAFLGSSQCALGVSVADFSDAWQQATGTPVDALNLGIPGARMGDVEAIHDVLLSRLEVRHVVLMVGLGSVTSEGSPAISRSYGMEWMRGRLSPADDALMQSWLFRYRRQWRDARWQFYVMKRRDLDGDLERRLGPDGRGWLPSGAGFGVLAPTVDPWRGGGVDPSFADWRVPEPAVASIARTIRLARDRGSDVTVVIPPMAPRASRAYGDLVALHEKLRAAVERACEETGTSVVDLHDAPGFGDEAFFDHHHLWADDARRFSRELARRLAESRPASAG